MKVFVEKILHRNRIEYRLNMYNKALDKAAMVKNFAFSLRKTLLAIVLISEYIP